MIVQNRHTAEADPNTALPPVLCDLPMFRPVALRMLKVLSREDPDFDEVVRIVESDPGFAVEILTVANSPLYAHSQVHTLMRALIVLGTERIKTLTMSVAMRACLKNFPQTEEMRRCWRHSRASALMAEEVAGKFGVQKERAYTAALMHDLGRFGLLAGSHDDYTKLLAQGHDDSAGLLRSEREKLGFDHATAGELLIKTWRLPAEISRVAAAHHEDAGEDSEVRLVQVVRTACRLATSLGFESVQYRCPADAEEIAAELPGRHRSAAELAELLQERFNGLALD